MGFARQVAIGLAGLFFLTLSGSPLRSEQITPTDEAAFRSIISGQISAFQSGDASKAYDYASPAVKRKFPNPVIFSAMAKFGYAPVYNPQSFEFDKTRHELSDPTQHVNVVGPHGKLWTALYGFERQADGSWLISRVVLFLRNGAGA